ncbi:PREDICTED: probable low-specificity L-threonine aldolase 2 [Rhagoletis zephyria]|uniref:probable low-specificity L-threonine aldolase 2 n=1 Tax=Rhagoletis zephyria TaxID=28612 RepID=UPI0008119A9E|nr:PREDICTED: probable low-specificity L-threonine aldolase 2 [Rhagoletis zephyria]
MTEYVIDIRSDTVSVPTPEMRKAMFEAVVGDDVYGEDPTVNALEEKAAKLFEKEAGLFVPSGTMGNLLACMVHCQQRGSEAIVGDLSHVYLYEQGGAAHIAGVQLATLPNNEDGTFCLEALRRKVRLEDDHEPITSLVIVENTQNICGGKVIPLQWLDKLAALLKGDKRLHPYGKRIALHMDGARIFNAAEALQVPVARIARDFDSVNFCLSKGLSAPVGSILVGSKSFIRHARRLRKALGGGMRQAGILAAAGIVALDTIVPRLRADHDRTRRIAEAIHKTQSPNVTVDLPNVHSNILLIRLPNAKFGASEFAERCAKVTREELAAGVFSANKEQGIVLQVSARDWEFARIVLYHQISDADVELAIKKLNYIISEIDGQPAA